jgi:hypothetical protein
VLVAGRVRLAAAAHVPLAAGCGVLVRFLFMLDVFLLLQLMFFLLVVLFLNFLIGFPLAVTWVLPVFLSVIISWSVFLVIFWICRWFRVYDVHLLQICLCWCRFNSCSECSVRICA